MLDHIDQANITSMEATLERSEDYSQGLVLYLERLES